MNAGTGRVGSTDMEGLWRAGRGGRNEGGEEMV